MQQSRLPDSLSKDDLQSWWKDIFFLLLFLGIVFFMLLGSRPLFVPDEGRYAEIAREMATANDYITPYLNGIKYFEKPVLFYWLGALAIKIGGLNLWSLRSVNAILGLFGCIFTYTTARKLYNRAVGLLSALVLGNSTLYFIMAHMVSLDLPVTVFLASCLYCFILGAQLPPGRARHWYFCSASAFAALAVLTKGLIGIVFPAMIVCAWIIIQGEWKQLKNLYLPSCLGLFLLLAAPWHILVQYYNPEFFYFYFIEQHFLRYTTLDVGHYQPGWFFIPVLLIGFFPWIVFLPQTVLNVFRGQRKQRASEMFFLLWATLIFIFFSFSKSKLMPYILPVLPPLSILTARYLQEAACAGRLFGIKAGYLFQLIAAIIFGCACALLTHFANTAQPAMANLFLIPAGLVLITGTITAVIFSYRNIKHALLTTIITSALFLILFLSSMQYADSRTVLPLAQKLKPMLQPQDVVVTFHQYYQDLPFYLERRVTVLDWQNELSYGMQHQDTHEWMIDENKFWQIWDSNKRVFVFMDIKHFQQLQSDHPKEKFYLLAQTPTTALIANSNVASN